MQKSYILYSLKNENKSEIVNYYENVKNILTIYKVNQYNADTIKESYCCINTFWKE